MPYSYEALIRMTHPIFSWNNNDLRYPILFILIFSGPCHRTLIHHAYVIRAYDREKFSNFGKFSHFHLKITLP